MKKHWRKGDLFRIDWNAVLSEELPISAKIYIRKCKEEIGDSVIEVVSASYRDPDDPILYYRVYQGIQAYYTGISIRHAIPVGKRKNKASITELG